MNPRTPPASAQVWKYVKATTAQNGAIIWTPGTGNRCVVTDVIVQTGGTTAGKITVWFGASGDTTYSAGTDQPILEADFIPSATVAERLQLKGPFVGASNYSLRYTTSAGITVQIIVYGYEISTK